MELHDFLRIELCRLQSYIEDASAKGVAPGEETITDLMLYQLASSPNSSCVVRRFNRIEENKIGTDFSLQVVSEINGVRVRLPMLVQAKRLFPTGRYESLHKSSANHPQTSRLIHAAQKHGALPIFAFYAASPTPRPAWAAPFLPSACDRVSSVCKHTSPPERDEADLAVGLAAAERVDAVTDAQGNRPTHGALAHLIYPMPCLDFCFCLTEHEDADDHEDDDVPPRPGQETSLVERAVSFAGRLALNAPLSRLPTPRWLDMVIDGQDDAVDEFLFGQPELEDVDALVVLHDLG